MNHHKHHRINTEEYQRELQGLNNSAQLPLFPRSQMTYPPEAKGRATHYPITHAQPLMKSELLLKANFKQLKQMFPNTNEHDHVLKWASDIKNNDLQSFYLRHYRNNPSIHTDAMKEKIGHINGMIDISDEMKKVKLSKEDTLESGLQKYEDAEKKWQSGNGSRFVTPSATTKPVINFGDGWGWFDLGVPSDRDEGNALGHCGNAGNPHGDDRILSLRKVHNIGGKIYHEPSLTFINNQGWIGEMKGRNNSKPSEKYHSRIVELLKHKDIKGLVGAGYMPENNFHFDDLSPEHKNQVKMTNPEFVDLRSNEWDIDHKTKTAANAPKITKYEDAIRDTFKAHNLKTDLDSGKITMDNIKDEDLRLVANHPHFERKDFDRLVENVHRIGRKNRLHAWGTIKNSRHLNSDDLHKLFGNDLDSVQVFKDHPEFNSSHIDKIIEKDPELAAEHLKDHKFFDSSHINKIAEKNPGVAAVHLKDHKDFNADHIDKIVEKNPSVAAIYLKNHKNFNLNHINKIVDKNPEAAAVHLKNHPLFNLQHIDEIVEKDPEAAAKYLKDHKDFDADHINKIIEKDPEGAAIHLNNHPALNEKHIDKIVEKDLFAAAYYLYNHPLFNLQHIDEIVKKDPEVAAKYLNDHSLFNSQHIDEIVEKDPELAAEHLAYHPYYIQKYGQKIQKSFRQLTNEYEELQKVIFRNGTHYPESTDRVGTPHPELQHLVVHKARNGKHVWSYHPELSRIHDRNLLQLMGGQKIAGRNNVQLPNKLASLQKPTVSAVRSFANDLINNPDRHVMSANTDPTKPADHSEMRVRHLISALTGSDGYEIKDHPEGFEVYAPRHSKSQKADDIATRWIYNAAKKDLRSERIYPTSPNGGSYGTKFGKSIRPRPSSNLGRRQANARKPAAQRPRPSEDAMGKTEIASKLLKAEDEAGMTAYSLRDGYSLHHETTSNGYDIWSIGHGGQRAGSFMICTDDTRRGRPFVSWAGVDKPHRGKGIGAAVYKTLAVHYGGLDSDRGSTSVDALKAWHRAGGKQLKSKTQFGDYRYTLKGDKKRPPIVWNEDLIKSFKSQWGGTLPDTDNSHVERNEWWHGTPSGRFPLNNIHVGSKRAAHEALTATIGHPVEGEWDGTREYGKTLLAGKKTLEAREIPITGYSVDAPFEDHYPTGKAKYSDGTQVSSSEKPNMLRFKIKGKMTSHPHTPRTDMAANTIMKRKGIKQGIYYVNEGEDPGSISAVVPSVEHLEQVINKKKNEDLEKTRGTLTFPKVLPKDTRPEENIKQIPKDEKAHPMYGGLYEVKPAQEQYLHTASKGVPKTHRHLAIAQLKNAMKTGLGVYLPKEDKGFAFVPDYATKAHEAIHAMVAKTAKHFDVHSDEVYHRMNSLIHQDDVPVLKHMLKTFGYPEQSHHEEMIPFVHSILHHQGARNQYLESLKLYHNNVDEEKGRKAIQRLGRTWNAILQTGKKVSQLSDLPKEG